MKIDDLIELGLAEDVAGDVWQLVEEMKDKYEQKVHDLMNKIDLIKIGYELDFALEKACVYSKNAVKALIDFENIKVEDEKVIGIDREIDRVKSECPMLFVGGDIPRVVSVTRGENSDKIGLMREIMGI